MGTENVETVRPSPSIRSCGRWAAIQALWQWLGADKDRRHAWMKYTLSVKLMLNCKAARLAAGLTTGELAARAGLSMSTVWRLEHFFNETIRTTINTLLAWAKACDCGFVVRFASWLEFIEGRNLPGPAPFKTASLNDLIAP